MKKIDRLLMLAGIVVNGVLGLFPGNEDGFMTALGIELDKYERVNPDGTKGYDFIAALNDTAVEDWKDYHEPVMVVKEEPKQDVIREPRPEKKLEEQKQPKARKFFGWG